MRGGRRAGPTRREDASPRRGVWGELGREVARPIFATVVYPVAWLVAIALLIVVGMMTIKWFGAVWLVLTLPAAILLSLPLLRWMSRLSEDSIL